MAAQEVDKERGLKTVTQFLTFLKAQDRETGKRAPRSTRGRAQNIVLGPTMAGGGVVRPRYVRRGAPISGRGRGRGQVSRGGLICPPDTNIVARGDGTTLQVGPLRPTWI